MVSTARQTAYHGLKRFPACRQIACGFVALLITSCSAAQDLPLIPALEQLPAWMNEKPGATASSAALPVPALPALKEPTAPRDPDPSSDVKAPAAPRNGGRVQFRFDRPKMPDLSEIRKKAVKTSYQRIATGTDQVLSEQYALEEIDQWAHQISELATQSLTAATPTDRQQFLDRQQSLQAKLDAARELATLLGFSGDTSRLASFTVDLNHFSPAQRQRFIELKTILGLTSDAVVSDSPRPVRPTRIDRQPALPVNLQTVPPTVGDPFPAADSSTSASITGSASTGIAAPAKPAKIPDRFYRPERIPLLGREHEEEVESDTEPASGTSETE